MNIKGEAKPPLFICLYFYFFLNFKKTIFILNFIKGDKKYSKSRAIGLFLFFLLPFFLSTPAFAEAEGGGAENFVNAGMATQSFISLFYIVSYVAGAALLLSIISTFSDYERFKQRAENPARQIVVRFLIAGILLNPSLSIKVMSETIGFETSRTNNFCFAYELKPKGGKESGIVADGQTRACYESNITQLQNKLMEKNNNIDKTELSNFLNGKFKVVVGVFQVIAMYFYLSAWFKIYSISEGKERQTTYGKQMIVILFSTFFLNLPAAINLVVEWVSNVLKAT